MRTSCPISTISYNTKDFLTNQLNQLNIEFWCAISHFPEKDESKKHYHVYIEPAKQMDTDSIRKALEEFTPENDKPLGCMPFRKSKFDDAILYFLHDKEYLASKFLVREYHYELTDFITNSFDYLMERYSMIERRKYCVQSKLVEFAEQLLPFSYVVSEGYVPIPLIGQYKIFYNELLENGLYRNGVETHTPKIQSLLPPELEQQKNIELLLSNAKVNDIDDILFKRSK